MQPQTQTQTTIKTSKPGANRRSPTFAEIYSNGFGFRISYNDIGMLFLRNVYDETGSMFPEEQVAVTMSPQQFKAMTMAAQEVLKAFESRYGALSSVQTPDLGGLTNNLGT